MSELVSDAVFTIRTIDRTITGGLFDIFACADEDTLIDLPAMRAHQRAAVVTALAVMMVSLQRYAAARLRSSSDWAAEWHRQIGEDALRLVAPESEPAFMQPPTEDARTELFIEAVDCLLPGVQHEVKTVDGAPEECWIFALMGGLARPYAKFHRPSTRVGLTAVLPSMDGSLGSEITCLVAGYQQLPSRDGTSAKDHMVWLRPMTRLTEPLVAADLPQPFLSTGRAVRLYAAGGALGARFAPSNEYRVLAPTQWLEEPHTPKLIGAEGVERFRLAKKHWGFDIQHQILFGGQRGKNEEVVRPRIMELVPYRTVRLCALGTDQGKTLGYWEAVYSATRKKQGFRLGPVGAEDRAADLSQRMLERLKSGQNHLSATLIRLLEIKDFDQLKHRAREKVIVDQANNHFRGLAGPASVQLVFDLLQEPIDLEADQQQMNTLVGAAMWKAFDRARAVTADYLTAAAAEDYLRATLDRRFGATSMVDHAERPHLVRQTYAVLQEMITHLTPDDRARLRTMSLSQPPLSFWMVLVAAPVEQTNDDGCISVWKSILRAMGRVGPSGPALGRVLAETEFPRDRVSRLLVATGSTLVGLIDEVARWLISHDMANADLSLLAALGLADALADTATREWTRRQIALDYVRAVRRDEARAA
jgi:hypothetical protein